MINLTINGLPVEATEGSTILSVAKAAGIEIPTLCFLEGVNNIGSCRLCVVEVEGMDKLPTACNTLIKEGMNIQTESERVVEARKTVLRLILANHHLDATVLCLVCTYPSVRKELMQLFSISNYF